MATQNIYSMVDTWNNAGTTFTGIGLNVTDTASSASSLLLDLQVGGSSKFKVSKSGAITGPVGGSFVLNAASGQNLALLATGGGSVGIYSSIAVYGGSAYFSFENDTTLVRDAANTLAQRNSTNAQTHRWYRTFTDTSNYSRVYLGWSSSTIILATEGAGTGSRGNIAFGTAALATSATVGYVMIPSSAGAPTGVPADIPTGQVALHYDSTNNKLYVYNGSWRATAALT